MNISGVGEMGVGEMGVGEMGQIIGEKGVGEMGVGETGTSRCKQRPLSLNVFKTQLKFMYKVHLHIASSHNEVTKFQNQWSLCQELINDIN